MAKTTAYTKGLIFKLFKAGTHIDEIRRQAREYTPKIATTSILAVIKGHLKDECDKLWSKVIHQVGRCEVCGNPDYSKLEAHHLIDRGNMNYRWDVSNGVCLDFLHHKWGNDVCAHGSNDVTSKFLDWLETNRPGQWLWLMEHRDNRQPRKWSNEELLAKLDELTAMLKTPIKQEIETRKPQ